MKNCIICGRPLVEEPLLVCENMPESAQNIPIKEALTDDNGITLNLCQCRGCGLVQFDCEPVSYYRDVIRAGGYSTTMTQLRRTQYSNLIEKYNLKGKKFIEVGCGQGEFLKVLTEFPVEAYGIENKAELVEMAREKGLNVVKNFAEDENTVIENGPFDVFLSFNFLEHQANPNAMMKCIYNNLTEDGYGLVTVPSFEYILEHDGFYELLHDHIANYTEGALEFLMMKNGFDVLEKEVINRDTWSFVVKKRKVINVSGLSKNFQFLKQQIHSFVDERVKENKRVAVWGASHQGFTALSTTGIGEKIAYVVDSAPFKQGKYSPASHVPIVSPAYFFTNPVDSIIIIAPGYTDEIAGTIIGKFGNDVEIAVLKTAKIELYK